MSNGILKKYPYSGLVVPSHPRSFTALPQLPEERLTRAFGLALPRSTSPLSHLIRHLKLLCLLVYPCMHQARSNEIYTYTYAHMMFSVIMV